ncbi:unnamed protein product, partial [marine sediment metagenome]
MSQILELYKAEDLPGFIRAGGSVEIWLNMQEGIPPFPIPKSNHGPLVVTKKSIQYSQRHYVDVKVCRPLGWNLVGNGASYELCGHIWYDEGKGCLNVKDHPGGAVYIRLIAGTCFRFECPVC